MMRVNKKVCDGCQKRHPYKRTPKYWWCTAPIKEGQLNRLSLLVNSGNFVPSDCIMKLEQTMSQK